MNEIPQIIGVLGLALDGFGAVVILFPEVKIFNKYLRETKEVSNIQNCYQKLLTNDEINPEDDCFPVLLDVLHNSGMATNYEPVQLSQDGDQFTGNLRVVEEIDENGTHHIGDDLDMYRFNSFYQTYLEAVENRRRFAILRLGAVFLLVGFALQIFSEILAL